MYLGRSPGGRLLAVKVVRDDFAQSSDVLSRFRREVETVRRVRSAYTAAMVDSDLVSKPYWLATEYVPGPTLGSAVRDDGPLPARTSLLLFAALAEALADVHAQAVSHRDLKPQNIILSTGGPRLIDFGIARAADHDALTQVGQTVGSPGYTAPEVITDSVVSPAADIFALGATMAYATTGRAPFGTNPAGVVYRTLNGGVDVEGVDPAVAALITSCVNPVPDRRPTPAEIIQRCDVRSALADDPVYRRIAAEAEPTSPAVASPAVAPPAPTIIVNAPAGNPIPAPAPTLLAAPQPLHSARPAPAPTPTRNRGRTVAWVSGFAALTITAVGVGVLMNYQEADDTQAGRGATKAPTTKPPAPQPLLPAGPVTGLAGKCLHVANSDTGDGALLQLWTCNGTDAQRWKIKANGRLQALGKCMDAQWSGTANGTPIHMWNCNGSGAQQWKSQPDGTLKNVASGRCLDVTEGREENGTPLVIWDCRPGSDNQTWRLPS